MAAGDVICIKENTFSKKGNHFDGTDDYVLHDAHAVARVAANDTVGTYSAWIYLDSYLSGGRTVLSAGDNDSANEYLQFHTGSTGNVYGVLKQGGSVRWQIYSDNVVPLRSWTHIALVHNGIRPFLYINGILESVTDEISTDLTMWYDELANCDKFAIGVLESNNTHTRDWKGAIGTVKYWNVALSPSEIEAYYKYESGAIDSTQLTEKIGSTRETALETALVFNVTMEDDGTTDSGSGADDGTLTGHAHYGGEISAHSRAIEANSSGHAAEFMNTLLIGGKPYTIIKRGD